MDHKRWIIDSEKNTIHWYSLAGAFSSFLIEKFGKEKFEKLYRNTNRKKTKEDNIDVFISEYNISLEDVEKKFKSFIIKKA